MSEYSTMHQCVVHLYNIFCQIINSYYCAAWLAQQRIKHVFYIMKTNAHHAVKMQFLYFFDSLSFSH